MIKTTLTCEECGWVATLTDSTRMLVIPEVERRMVAHREHSHGGEEKRIWIHWEES